MKANLMLKNSALLDIRLFLLYVREISAALLPFRLIVDIVVSGTGGESIYGGKFPGNILM